MKWLETIELRTNTHYSEQVHKEIILLLKKLKNLESNLDIHFYTQINIKSDFNITIYHVQKLTDNEKSETGALIASQLRKYGIVNHTIWQEKKII